MDLARAVEDNNAQFLLALGRAGGGAERNDEHLAWTIGGSPLAYPFFSFPRHHPSAVLWEYQEPRSLDCRSI